jgi:hypothetical protein
MKREKKMMDREHNIGGPGVYFHDPLEQRRLDTEKMQFLADFEEVYDQCDDMWY